MKHFILIFAVLLFTQAMGQGTGVRQKQYNLKKGIALEGYDPVSYFDGKPAEGSDDISLEYQGVTYHFATQANLAKFRESPAKYEPAYGGWCAFAMGESGEKVKIDPKTYKIANGKLYLFYNFWGNNTLTDWNKNEQSLQSKADQHWKKFIP